MYASDTIGKFRGTGFDTEAGLTGAAVFDEQAALIVAGRRDRRLLNRQPRTVEVAEALRTLALIAAVVRL